jgi:hypothetical protein
VVVVAVVPVEQANNSSIPMLILIKHFACSLYEQNKKLS